MALMWTVLGCLTPVFAVGPRVLQGSHSSIGTPRTPGRLYQRWQFTIPPVVAFPHLNRRERRASGGISVPRSAHRLVVAQLPPVYALKTFVKQISLPNVMAELDKKIEVRLRPVAMENIFC